MFRFPAAIAALALAGCATTDRPSAAFAEPVASMPATSGERFERVSLNTPSTATGAPTGLAPCPRGVFAPDACWRRGDQHILYPQSPPGGIDMTEDREAVARR